MLQNKNFTILLSIVLAIFLWVYVVTVENPPTKTRIPNVPIQILNMESLTQRGLALTENEDYYVDIVIEGKRADVLKVSAGDIIATADVFGYGVGNNEIPITVTVPDAVSLSDQKLNKLSITIEELVSVYKTVNVIFEGTTDESLEPTIFSITPEEVEVKGAKSNVANVSSVNARIDVSGLTSRKQKFTSELTIVDSNGEVLDNVRLSSGSAEIEAAVYKIKEVPLEVEVTGEIGRDYEVTEINIPESVKIKGLDADLKDIEKVTAEAIDISNVIATTELPVSINLPEGVVLAQDSESISVGITIKGISVNTFEIDSSKIIYENLAEGLSLVINSQNVTVKVSGKEAIISTLREEDIILTIDLEGLDAGIHTVPVKDASDVELSEISITPSEIHITINEAV